MASNSARNCGGSASALTLVAMVTISLALARLLARPDRSRGPPCPIDRRAMIRSISDSPAIFTRICSHISIWCRNHATSSCRSMMLSALPSGAASRSASRRPPAAVTVLSIACSRLPRDSPASVLVSSSDRRVAGSISIWAASTIVCRRLSGGMLPICVVSR